MDTVDLVGSWDWGHPLVRSRVFSSGVLVFRVFCWTMWVGVVSPRGLDNLADVFEDVRSGDSVSVRSDCN